MAVTAVVCGPASQPGVTYVNVAGHPALCGTDSSGNSLMLQVSTLSSDDPVNGGEVAGFEIGGAVLLVMASAWCVRAVKRVLDSSGEV